jgi:pyruvate kinase
MIVVTRDIHVSRRMALVWGVRSVLEKAELDYDSMVSMARDESAKLIEPTAGEKFMILAGVPFGQTGSTNNIRVATYR